MNRGKTREFKVTPSMFSYVLFASITVLLPSNTSRCLYFPLFYRLPSDSPLLFLHTQKIYPQSALSYQPRNIGANAQHCVYQSLINTSHPCLWLLMSYFDYRERLFYIGLPFYTPKDRVRWEKEKGVKTTMDLEVFNRLGSNVRRR